jgi:hypothetical protein
MPVLRRPSSASRSRRETVSGHSLLGSRRRLFRSCCATRSTLSPASPNAASVPQPAGDDRHHHAQQQAAIRHPGRFTTGGGIWCGQEAGLELWSASPPEASDKLFVLVGVTGFEPVASAV